MQATTTNPAGGRSGTFRDQVAAVGVFCCAFSLYLYNLAPDVIWGDSAKLCLQSYTSHLGVAPSMHSLHTIAGQLFGRLPFGSYAYRLNLMSAFWGAATVAAVFMIVAYLTDSVFSALAAAASLAVSHTLFFLSVIAESYTFYTFFLALALYFALKWSKEGTCRSLYLACFFFCLGTYAHLVIILMAPGLLYCLIASGRKSAIGYEQVLWLLGAALLGFATAIIVAWHTGSNAGISGLLGHVSRDPSNSWVYFKNPFELLLGSAKYLAMLSYQFPVAGFCLGTAGAIACRTKDGTTFKTLALMFFCNVFFVLHYGLQKQYSLYIGSYVVFAVWIGLGSRYLIESAGQYGAVSKAAVLIALTALPFGFYPGTLAAVEKYGIDLVGARTIPYRYNNAFFLVPWKRNERGPSLYANEVFRAAEPGSIIYADYTVIKVLDYFREVAQSRGDLRLLFVDYPFSKVDLGLIEANIKTVPVYLASAQLELDYHLQELKKKYALKQRGVLYRLVKIK